MKPYIKILQDSELQIKQVQQDQQFEIKQYINELQLQLSKFESHSRTKRGLVNLVGKINKYLWGTLDSGDLEEINSKFDILMNNQEQIQEVINIRTSILRNITKSFERTTQELLENQKQIATRVNLYVQKINTVEFRILLQKCITNLEFLNEAIQLSHFGISSPYLISKELISEMNARLEELYKPEQLLKLEINYSIISIIRTDINILEDSLLLHFSYPIFHPTNYNQYKLTPIPLINFTMIPPYPIILLPENTHSSLWYKEDCQSLEEYSLCLDELPQRLEDTCYESLLRGQPGLCPKAKIQLNCSFIDIIYNRLVIIPVNENLLVKEVCSKHLTTTPISTPSIITLNDDCTTEIKDEIISTPETKLPSQTIILPNPKYSNFSIDISDKSLQCLDDIQKSISELPPVHIRHFLRNSSDYFWIWLTLGIIILVILLYMCHKKMCLHYDLYHRILRRSVARETTRSEEKPRSSSPEPVTSGSTNDGSTPSYRPPKNPF